MIVAAAVYALKYEWQDEPSYQVFVGARYNTEEEINKLARQEYVYISPIHLDIEELTPGQFRARQVAALRKKKEALRDEFTKQAGYVQDHIENLLALGDESHDL